MGRTPCSLKQGLNRGAWTAKEDRILAEYVEAHGEIGWRTLPKKAGLNRCGKSCRLRWLNYLRPNIKRGNISADEEDLILRLHRLLGNRWALIAGRLPGRTDNEIKNYWNTHLSKKLALSGVDPKTHKPIPEAARTPSSPKANFPVQKQNSPHGLFSEKSNINAMHLSPLEHSPQHNTVGTRNSAGMPMCVGGHDQVDLSKSWSQLLEDTCASNVYDNLELIDIQPSNGNPVSESQSFKVPSVSTEFEQPVGLLECSNSAQTISGSSDSYLDPDCVPLIFANSIDSRSIEEFCMGCLLIETPDCASEEIYGPPERIDCNEIFDHNNRNNNNNNNLDCLPMDDAAEQGMNEICNNTLQLDWTHELLEQFLHEHSTGDLDGSLDHLLGPEHEDFWSDELVVNPQRGKDNYVDIVVDLSLEE